MRRQILEMVKEIDGDVVDDDTSAARALSHKPLQLPPSR